ncbi:DMBT1 protein, partial [Eubucco bourcierii]|nr:DMBT1 protein [Eubucco bourcierii]
RCSGRVEIFHGHQWGTVCDHSWDLRDAAAVCRQLDCGWALAAPGGAPFGQGNGTIWLERVSCVGTEELLAWCPAGPWGATSCTHAEDAGVVCSGQGQLLPGEVAAGHIRIGAEHLQGGNAAVPQAEELRLAGGSQRCAGRVEVLHREQWGAVCAHGWDRQDAEVVCRQLGCG